MRDTKKEKKSEQNLTIAQVWKALKTLQKNEKSAERETQKNKKEAA